MKKVGCIYFVNNVAFADVILTSTEIFSSLLGKNFAFSTLDMAFIITFLFYYKIRISRSNFSFFLKIICLSSPNISCLQLIRYPFHILVYQQSSILSFWYWNILVRKDCWLIGFLQYNLFREDPLLISMKELFSKFPLKDFFL